MEKPPVDHSWLEVGRDIASSFPTYNTSIVRITNQVLRLHDVFKTTRDAMQKRVLDLGCGCVHSDENILFKMNLLWLFPIQIRHPNADTSPWFCRLAHKAGADTTGIDIGDNSSESFHVMNMDLFNPSNLQAIESNSMDLINNDRFTVPRESEEAPGAISPALCDKIGEDLGLKKIGGWYDQKVYDKAYEINGEIRREAERMLRLGGKYLCGELIYEKKRSGLQKIRKK